MKSGVSGAPCPECESIRTATTGTGYTDQGYRLRRRKCLDCDAGSFLTIEVAIDASWGELDSMYNWRQRQYARARAGYKGKTQLAHPIGVSTLEVDVKVVRSGRSRRPERAA
jgi:hypothetical protein